jgi:hypothetical protein
MYVTFNRFEIIITKKEAALMSHQGDCDADVSAALPRYRRQLEKIGVDKIRDELREYGAWDEEQLADDTENMKRILWLAAGDIQEHTPAGK